MIMFTRVHSPVGPLLLAATDEGLQLIEFHQLRNPAQRTDSWQEREHPVLHRARAQLGEYFAGDRKQFDLPLAPQGTPFQREVWSALAAIPYGQTVSYSELATRAGRSRAVRAVGAAIGRNPLPIVVPCHRVVGTNGSLTGFSGGLPAKRHLLVLEGVRISGSDSVDKRPAQA